MKETWKWDFELSQDHCLYQIPIGLSYSEHGMAFFVKPWSPWTPLTVIPGYFSVCFYPFILFKYLSLKIYLKAIVRPVSLSVQTKTLICVSPQTYTQSFWYVGAQKTYKRRFVPEEKMTEVGCKTIWNSKDCGKCGEQHNIVIIEEFNRPPHTWDVNPCLNDPT